MNLARNEFWLGGIEAEVSNQPNAPGWKKD
jgi:hypothetical protein